MRRIIEAENEREGIGCEQFPGVNKEENRQCFEPCNLNLKAKNDEILNRWMNGNNINVYYVKNTQKTMIDAEF